ncbi:hypothetical protein Mapa_012519 [Marchantia paleacea]|nr:hypothetical protein Mapa_012519 [Marchantia paleacea]
MKLFISLLCFTAVFITRLQAAKFWDDFYVTYGEENVKYPGSDPGYIVQLGLTNRTGSGFRSKLPYLYGEVSMKVKLVEGNSAGTVTSYYMASTFKNWCELDFEFLGNVSGQPCILQTNVFSEGVGNREQRIYLWFDPTADYHNYSILWNQALILFKVDDRVIRVFHKATDLGIPYLDYQPMYIYSSIWNGETWATRGGRDKTDWTKQPFIASYKGFNISNACSVKDSGSTEDLHACYKMLYQSSYGQAPNLALSQTQIDHLKLIQKDFLIYDYCTDTKRTKNVPPPECSRNWPSLTLPSAERASSTESHGLSVLDLSPKLSRDRLTV